MSVWFLYRCVCGVSCVHRHVLESARGRGCECVRGVCVGVSALECGCGVWHVCLTLRGCRQAGLFLVVTGGLCPQTASCPHVNAEQNLPQHEPGRPCLPAG